MSETEDGRLAALTRDILGAKGLLEITKGLLESLDPERRAQLAEDLIRQSSYQLQNSLSEMFLRELSPATRQRIKEAVEQVIKDKEADIVASIAKDVERAVTQAARETLGRYR